MEDKKLTEHFKLSEFEASTTAKAKKIDNTIPEKYMDNVQRLAELLEKIRVKWDGAIKITSGYRCKALNDAVKGAKNSSHLYASAADIKPSKGKVKDLFNLIHCMIDLKEIECHQLIDEYNYSWIHISVNCDERPYKLNQILHIK